MATLLLKLAAPMQSWGASSRFTERKTRHEPTKSGIVGLLASALGRRRNEDISDLASLLMGVRIDQAGHFERDFQSAHTRKFDKTRRCWVFDKSMPLSRRYYLSDAVFVVGLEGPDELLLECAHALDHPRFPLYLGRRSCSPACRLLLAYKQDESLLEALERCPWEASERIKHGRMNEMEIELELMRDQLPNDNEFMTREDVCDVPIEFCQEHRKYSLRTVIHDKVTVQNPNAIGEHDPFALLEGAE